MAPDLAGGVSAAAPFAEAPVAAAITRTDPAVRTGETAAPAAPGGGWLERWLGAARPEDYRRGFRAFAAVASALFLLVWLHGPCLQTAYGHDAIGFLSSAWKVRCGVLPHADYHTPLGALNPWLLAAGMWLLGPSATVLPFCNALVALAFGLLAWRVASRRLPAWPAAFFALTQMVVAMAPHLMRFRWWASTYDGYYNRQGYALLCTLSLLLFVAPRPGRDADAGDRWDGRWAGAVLGLLLFLKISYLMAGVVLCAIALAGAKRLSRSLVWNGAAAFGVVLLACLPLIRFDLLAMLGDLRMAAAARVDEPAAAFTLGNYLRWLPKSWVEILLLAAVQSLLVGKWVFSRTAAQPAVPPYSLRGWLVWAGVVMVSLLVSSTNAYAGTSSELPLLATWGFVLLAGWLQILASPGQPEALRHAARKTLPVLCVLMGFLWISTYGNGLRCLLWSASPWPTRWQQAALAQTPVFDSEPLAPLAILGNGGQPAVPVTYAEKINDGLHLLRKVSHTPQRVESFDFVNPFPFALQWPVLRNGLWCWDRGFSFGRAAHPSAEEAFGQVELLMVPKYPSATPESFALMNDLYAAYVIAHFAPAGESDQWYVMRRR